MLKLLSYLFVACLPKLDCKLHEGRDCVCLEGPSSNAQDGELCLSLYVLKIYLWEERKEGILTLQRLSERCRYCMSNIEHPPWYVAGIHWTVTLISNSCPTHCS